MRDKSNHYRRQLLQAAGLIGAGAIAGCLGGDSDDDSDTGDDIDTGDDSDDGDDGDDGDVEFPTDDMTLLIGWGPGGGFDTYSRLLAKHMTERLDVDVNPEQMEGAGGRVAFEHIYNDAEPDGHTFATTNIPTLVRDQILEDVRYDAPEATHYGTIDVSTAAIAVRADSGIETVDDYITAVQNEELQFGTTGPRGDGVLVPLTLGELSGVYDPDIVENNWVSYDGTGEIVNGMVAGDVDVIGTSYASLPPFEESGDIRVLLYFSGENEVPFPDLTPDAVNLAEAGIEPADDLEVMNATHRGLAGPPDVPDDVAERLADIIGDTINSDALLQEAEEMDRPIVYNTREETQDIVSTQFELWTEHEDLLL